MFNAVIVNTSSPGNGLPHNLGWFNELEGYLDL